MKRYLVMALVGLAAVALLGAACGGGDDDAGAGDEPTSAADNGGNGNGDSGGDGDAGDSGDGDAGDDDSGNGDSGNGGNGDGDAGDDDSGDGGFSAVMEAASALSPENSYKVTYQMTSEGEPDGAFSGTFTIASDPPRQLFRMEGTFDGVDTILSLISDEDSSVVCVEGDEPGTCISFGSGGSSPFPLPAFFDAPNLVGSFTTADGVSVSSAGSENIAGQAATCYNVTSDEGDAKVCIADDGGRLLSVQFDDGETTFLLVVVEFGDPSAEDFEPPFDVIDFG
jgi:hypothetical protein